MSGKLEALGLAAAECGNRLPQRDVAETHAAQRLEPPRYAFGEGKHFDRLVDGELEDVGDGESAADGRRVHARGVTIPGFSGRRRNHLHVEHVGAVASAVAFWTPKVDVAQKLHLYVLEPVPSAGRAATVAGVETEGAGGVAALTCQRLAGEKLSYLVERTHIARRIRAGRLTDGGLIDHHHIVYVLETRE